MKAKGLYEKRVMGLRLTSFHRITLPFVYIISFPPIAYTRPHPIRLAAIKTGLISDATHLVNVGVLRGIKKAGREILVGGCVTWFGQSRHPTPLPRLRQRVVVHRHPLTQALHTQIQIGAGIGLCREFRSAGAGRRVDVDESGRRSSEIWAAPFVSW